MVERRRRNPATVLRGKRIGFIGVGTMGYGLIRGLIACGMRPRSIVAADPRSAARRRVGRLGVRTTLRNGDVARTADVLVLAVKPQEMGSVLGRLTPQIDRRTTVISIAAGVTLRALEARLPRVPIVRVMPNLPATVGRGFAAFVLGRKAGAQHRAIARAIFEAVGEAVELPERLLDAVTAVSGSGPAYLFFLAQAWEEAAAALGLPRAVAQRSVRQTIEGSLTLLNQGDLSPEGWIARVASKRGTTEAALRVLARHQVRAHFVEAVRAAARRSKEISCSSLTS